MSDLPLTSAELRHRQREEPTAEVPVELSALAPTKALPTKEVRFIERRADDEPAVTTPSTVDGYRPPWMAASFRPRPARGPRPINVVHHGRRLKPMIIFEPDDRRIYDDRSYPWGCVCKVTTARGAQGSGVLIGLRHVLTASHCVDWFTSDAERIDVHLTGLTAAATAFDTLVYAFTHIPGPDVPDTQLDEDYAALVLNARLGDRFGWFGTKTYDSGWDGDNVWWTFGCPGDVGEGTQPTFQRDKNLDEDAWDLGSGTRDDDLSGHQIGPVGRANVRNLGRRHRIRGRRRVGGRRRRQLVLRRFRPRSTGQAGT